MKKLILPFLVIFSISCSQCSKDSSVPETNNPPIVQLTNYQQDFNQLKSVILDTHPALYDFMSAGEFETFLDDQYAKISASTTPDEFFTIVAPVVAKIGCVHSTMFLPDYFYNNLGSKKVLPFKFLIHEDKLLVYRDYNGSGIPLGAEIRSINDVSINEILSTLMQDISADGYRKTGKEYRLNSDFRKYFAIHYGEFDEFNIGYSDNGAEAELEVASLTYSEIQTIYNANYAKPASLDLSIQINSENKSAVIRIKSFMYYGGENAEFFAFVDDCFTQIRENNIENIILDLRGNGGGDPYCASYLLKHLTNQSITYFSAEVPSYQELKVPIAPVDPDFSATVYTLINGGCASTTGHFTALMEYHNVCTFVGLETNGSFSCNDASNSHRLQKSNFRYQLAERTYAVAVVGKSLFEGVLPDYPIEPSIDDMVNGIDTEMEFVKTLIANSQ